MLFVLAKILGVLFRPSAILLLLCCAGLVLCRLGRSAGAKRWGRRALYAGVGGLACIGVLPVGQWMLKPLEDRFPQIAHPPAHVDGIIVLGGAVSPERTQERGIPALTGAAERMTEFVALSRRYPSARLAFTGGSGELIPDALREADVARALFTELGVPQDRMTYEAASRTTYENAVLSKRLVDPKPGETWLLVTSANHMPRSVGVFRRVGWPVLPWPVAYQTTFRGNLAFLAPLGGNLNDVDLAVHEWLGLLAYYLTGRSEVLFPGP